MHKLRDILDFVEVRFKDKETGEKKPEMFDGSFG
jgi:hypothetical protein